MAIYIATNGRRLRLPLIVDRAGNQERVYLLFENGRLFLDDASPEAAALDDALKRYPAVRATCQKIDRHQLDAMAKQSLEQVSSQLVKGSFDSRAHATHQVAAAKQAALRASAPGKVPGQVQPHLNVASDVGDMLDTDQVDPMSGADDDTADDGFIPRADKAEPQQEKPASANLGALMKAQLAQR